jgi:ABC-type uncharacterized transport system involved in gliding motility auxiliary subunit
MNIWLRFLGIAGLVVLLFGLLGKMILAPGELGGFVWLHFIAGLAAIVAWFFSTGTKNLSNAGELLRGRTSRFGANVVLYVVVFLGFIGFFNFLANRYDHRFDLTSEGVYSLKPQTVKLLQSLQKPLKLIGIRQGSGEDQQLEERLKLYAYYNPERVSYEMINPVSRPQVVKQLRMEAGQSIFISLGEQESRLTSSSEQSITNAILKLVRGGERKIYYITGHGEPDIQGAGEEGVQALGTALKDEQFNLEALNLSQKGSVPADAAAVILVAPEKELLKEERDLLIKYARDGGRLVLFHEVQQSTDDVRLIAREFGIEVGTDVVIEPELRLFTGPVLNVQPQVVNFKSHAVTADFSPRTPVVLVTASSVKQAPTAPSVGTVSVLMETGEQAWGETNVQGLFDPVNPEVSFSALEDHKGPVPLAAVYEHEVAASADNGGETAEPKFEKRTRVVVFGDSDWIRNGSFRQFFNRDLVLAAVNWSSAEEGGLALEARSLDDGKPRSPIADDVVRNIFFTSFILPELFLLLGLAIWWQRRTAYV